MLLLIASIAIWNRNKAVLALATTIWSANVALHLQSKSLPSTQKTWDLIQRGMGTDVIRVNGQLFCYSCFFWLILLLASLRLGPCTPLL